MQSIQTILNNNHQVQVQPELKPLKSGDNDFAVAIKDKRIENDLQGLREALRYVMLLVGVRANNLPNDEEKAVLISYIIENYGGHTPAEIRLAFKKALAGELKVEDVVCYENFSVLYFSTIMNAYRQWARDEYKMVPEPPQQKLEPEWLLDLRIAMNLQRELRKRLLPPLKF